MEYNYQPLLQKLTLAIQLGYTDLFIFTKDGQLHLSNDAAMLYSLSNVSYSIIDCSECNTDIYLIRTNDGKYKARAVKYISKRSPFTSLNVENTNIQSFRQLEEYTPLLVQQGSSVRHLNLRTLLTSHFVTSKHINNENK